MVLVFYLLLFSSCILLLVWTVSVLSFPFILSKFRDSGDFRGSTTDILLISLTLPLEFSVMSFIEAILEL